MRKQTSVVKKNIKPNRCQLKPFYHLVGYKALGKSLNFSEPWIPHMENFVVKKKTCLYSYCKRWNNLSEAHDSVTNYNWLLNQY